MTQSNIMYFINAASDYEHVFNENTVMDTSICTHLDVTLDSLSLDNYNFATQSGDSSSHTLHIQTNSKSKAGLYSG